MMLHEINAGKATRNRRRRRVGRGESSNWGKTSGRGHKGAGQRTGRRHPVRNEGGNMPYFRKIPKRGFSNFRFRQEFQVINLKDLETAFEAGQTVDPAALADQRLIRETEAPVKVLGAGKLSKALTVKAHKFSESAAEAIRAVGGTVEIMS